MNNLEERGRGATQQQFIPESKGSDRPGLARALRRGGHRVATRRAPERLKQDRADELRTRESDAHGRSPIAGRLFAEVLKLLAGLFQCPEGGLDFLAAEVAIEPIPLPRRRTNQTLQRDFQEAGHEILHGVAAVRLFQNAF